MSRLIILSAKKILMNIVVIKTRARVRELSQNDSYTFEFLNIISRL